MKKIIFICLIIVVFLSCNKDKSILLNSKLLEFKKVENLTNFNNVILNLKANENFLIFQSPNAYVTLNKDLIFKHQVNKTTSLEKNNFSSNNVVTIYNDNFGFGIYNIEYDPYRPKDIKISDLDTGKWIIKNISIKDDNKFLIILNHIDNPNLSNFVVFDYTNGKIENKKNIKNTHGFLNVIVNNNIFQLISSSSFHYYYFFIDKNDNLTKSINDFPKSNNLLFSFNNQIFQSNYFNLGDKEDKNINISNDYGETIAKSLKPKETYANYIQFFVTKEKIYSLNNNGYLYEFKFNDTQYEFIKISDFNFKNMTISNIVEFNNKIIVGTHNGLYYSEIKN